MFTGIIEELGSISAFAGGSDGARITINAKLVTGDAAEGDSIAVNGVCLTALDITANSFTADVSAETLKRSTLGNLATGSLVNLERAVTPLTRLGGHIVQGHVDGRGTFMSAVESNGFYTVKIGFPSDLSRYFIEKGSVSIEGISLTIASLDNDSFDIAVIPKTWTATNFHTLSPGDAVNLEVDMIAKYVERLLNTEKNATAEAISLDTLRNAGYSL